jgi:hypothetical protein
MGRFRKTDKRCNFKLQSQVVNRVLRATVISHLGTLARHLLHVSKQCDFKESFTKYRSCWHFTVVSRASVTSFLSFGVFAQVSFRSCQV